VADSSLAIAVAAHAHPGETLSGDAWRVDWHKGVCRLAVVDGLGHGPAAAAAATAATTALATDPSLDPMEAVQACHSALSGTRGAALLVAAIDLAAQRLTIAGAGNVEARLWQGGRGQHLVTDRGIVGAVIPRVRPIEVELEDVWLLLIHSDGVRNRLDVDCPILSSMEAQSIADVVLNEWSRGTDDATVLVARPA